MVKAWNAGCACGQLSMRIEGSPRLVSSCCCEACQKRTGAFLGITTFFDEAQVTERSGEAGVWRRVAESGNGIDYRFCPICGSTVWWQADARPGMVMVAGGCIADPELPSPERIIWTEYRHPSVCVQDGVQEFRRGPN